MIRKAAPKVRNVPVRKKKAKRAPRKKAIKAKAALAPAPVVIIDPLPRLRRSLMISDGWRLFLRNVQQADPAAAIHEDAAAIPEDRAGMVNYGCFCLLEESLGRELRFCCPIFFKPDESLVNAIPVAKVRSLLECGISKSVAQELHRVYEEKAHWHRETTWPTVSLLRNLRPVLRALLAKHIASLMCPNYEEFVRIRYGLADNKPEASMKLVAERLSAIWEREIAESTLNNWRDRIRTFLQCTDVKRQLRLFVEAFSVRRMTEWRYIRRQALEDLGVQSETVTIDANITDFFTDGRNSVRYTNLLEGRGIFTLRDLVSTPREDLESGSGIGDITMDVIKNCLASLGLHLEMTEKEIDQWEPPASEPAS
jgi:hypothetical protein